MKSQTNLVNTCPAINQTNSWVSVSSSTYEECKIELLAISQNIIISIDISNKTCVNECIT